MNKVKFGLIGIVIPIMVVAFFLFNTNTEETKLPTLQENQKQANLMQIEISNQDYEELLYNTQENTIVIFPIFTGFAYNENGFYDYYTGKCDKSCLTVNVEAELPLQYASSQQAFMLLQLLEYPYTTDLQVTKNPEILKEYDKIILLHNEYVTQNEFDAINDHKKVVYLYPNALYAKVDYNERQNTITLVRGHGYPQPEIDNGFEWEFDNTRPYEYDTECKNWKFYEIDNGIMLNCYPEKIITEKLDIIRKIKEY